MKKKHIAVVGVLHPFVQDFLRQYLNSLSKQTFVDFDLILFNDGLRDKRIFKDFLNLNIEINNIKGTPSQNRKSIVDYLKNSQYEYIVFTDCDDYLSKNRIEISLIKLEKSKIVFNDLNLIKKNKKTKFNYFSNRISNEEYFSLADLYNFNILGFTNTSLKKEVLKNVSFLRNDIEVFDWYFWTTILCKEEAALFTNETVTNYRIHSANTAGLPQSLSKKLIIQGVNVKKNHYQAFSKTNRNFKKLYETFNYIHIMLEHKEWQEQYIKNLKEDKVQNPFWWENIRFYENLLKQ